MIMYWKALAFAICFPPLTGCLMAEHTVRNLFNEPAELRDNKKIVRRLRHDAKQVWNQVCQQYPQQTFSADYVDGFQAGYVDYLDSGGTAQPPAVPPLKYRRSRYMSVEGHAQIRDYFCGFKYGCEVAATSGQRDLITVPILLPEPPVDGPVQARQISAVSVIASPRIPEALPTPKAVSFGTGLPMLDRPLATAPAMGLPISRDAPTVNIPELTPEPLVPAAFVPNSPVVESGTVGPLRELPNTVVKPWNPEYDAQKNPPWRGN